MECVILSLTTLCAVKCFWRHYGVDAGSSAISLSQIVLTFRPKLVTVLNLAAGPQAPPSISSGLAPTITDFDLPDFSGRQAAHSSARFPSSVHGMTRAHLHTALHSCVYVQSSRNIRYNLTASLRATATLAKGRFFRIASRA